MSDFLTVNTRFLSSVILFFLPEKTYHFKFNKLAMQK